MHHVLYMYMSFIFARFFVCVHFSSFSICPLCFFVIGGQLRWASAFTGSMPLLQLMYMLCISTWQINSLSLSASLFNCHFSHCCATSDNVLSKKKHCMSLSNIKLAVTLSKQHIKRETESHLWLHRYTFRG